MKNTYRYASVSIALEELAQMGFVYDYNLHEDTIVNEPTDLEIIHIYRYEGNSNPADESVVYGIQSKDGTKGVFVAGFAANSISAATRALITIEIKGRN
ncbi:hypothetical protein HNQ02_000563 [Flavobacterium sp. 7E]|uniref:hypothetical protein n=1 Tax=Flavobacterium sp. 7E TaxID=2735898 RepID=UPI00156F8511|nr:hypothetical protein [Flavobacterium sp. 7E]NRS87656.1 hypothetical protein [Flavobacterium sp. 7E]